MELHSLRRVAFFLGAHGVRRTGECLPLSADGGVVYHEDCVAGKPCVRHRRRRRGNATYPRSTKVQMNGSDDAILLAIRRHAIGVLGLALLAGGVWFHFFPPQTTAQITLESACWRGGSIAVVVWLAFDQIIRLPTWALVAVPIVLAILAFRPKIMIVVIPVLIVLALLRPRKKKSNRRSPRRPRSKRGP